VGLERGALAARSVLRVAILLWAMAAVADTLPFTTLPVAGVLVSEGLESLVAARFCPMLLTLPVKVAVVPLMFHPQDGGAIVA
jgi:hypothetical protein